MGALRFKYTIYRQSRDDPSSVYKPSRCDYGRLLHCAICIYFHPSFARAVMRGFTLIELAIAIAVIAVLTVGVLKGQALIDSARVQDATKKAQDLIDAIDTFKSKYRLLPGDIPNPAVPNLSATCSAGGNGNGIIDATESACIPEVLYKSGMIGMVDSSVNPIIIKSHYGQIVVLSRQFSNITYPTSVSKVIELQDLPCEAIASIDRNIDNNNPSTGKVISSNPTCSNGDIVEYLGIAF